MRPILGACLTAAAALPLAGCCALIAPFCEVEAAATPPRVTRDTPGGAVDFLVDAMRRSAPAEIYESLHPEFIRREGDFSLGEFAAAFDRYKEEFAADAARLAGATKDAPRLGADGLATVRVHDGDAELHLTFRNRPASRVVIDDDLIDAPIVGAVPDLREIVSVEGDALRVNAGLPLQGQGDFVDPARIRRVELYQDWLLVGVRVPDPRSIRFLRVIEETKGGRP